MSSKDVLGCARIAWSTRGTPRSSGSAPSGAQADHRARTQEAARSTVLAVAASLATSVALGGPLIARSVAIAVSTLARAVAPNAAPGQVDLSDIAAGSGGLIINGQCAGDFSGSSVAGAGDVNGDGLADVIVGAQSRDPAAGNSAGRSYVVFGKTGTTVTSLSDIAAGSGGFVINGQCAVDLSGTNVAGAGDVNGDGLSDLIVGAPVSDPSEGSDAGRSYVVFGKAGTDAIDLSTVAAGSGGFVITATRMPASVPGAAM